MYLRLILHGENDENPPGARGLSFFGALVRHRAEEPFYPPSNVTAPLEFDEASWEDLSKELCLMLDSKLGEVGVHFFH